ncbi:MAG: malonyl-CoA synthase [Gammaproteobacteria bacterium]|nr:MAG: malonyl-CoA synthase [Gammaproteobacteria bacterium]
MSNPLYDALRAGRSAGNGVLFVDNSGAALLDDIAFFDRAARMATVLAAVRVRPGDRVAVQVGKSIDALALYLACVQSAAAFLPLNTAYTDSELDYFLGDAEPALFVVDPSRRESAMRLTSDRPVAVMTLGSAGDGTLAEAAHAASPREDAEPAANDALAAILYTSGTTGRSKGAMLTQHNLLSNGRTLVEAWRFTPEDVLLHALPIFHTHGLFVAGNVALLAGARMMFQPRFDLDEVLAAMPHATSMMGVPTFYTRLLDDARFTRELAAHMRLFTSGSAPLLPETHRAFEARTGQRILERYGMTETSMSTSNPYEGERRAGTVGLPLPGVEVRIRDTASGELIPDTDHDTIGMLEVRGPNVFRGYWRMPEKTREELLEDGFFITGDLVRRDADGYLTIVGRSRDLVITGGYNVYPKEVESVIDDIEGVRESAVFGVPHPDLGEAVAAVIVPTADVSAEDTEALARRVPDACAASLARFKVPKQVMVLDALPRNTMGKVQKNQLRQDYRDLFA